MAKYSIGGQALIEGVMMRGPKKVALAVRNASGTIVEEEWDNDMSNRHKIFKVPFIRGIFNFIDSMKIGYTTLMKSADIAMTYDEGDENKHNDEAEKQEDDNGILMNIAMVISSILGVCLSVGLFVWLPTFLFNLLKGIIPGLNTSLWQSVFEGVIKIIIFITYVALCSLMKDMKRVFMYHGAEHKTIFCYEQGLELTVENVKKQIRFHPRCGTSFLALMLIISIFVGLFIPHDIPTIIRVGIKLLCIPIVMGIGYEAIKLAGRKDNLFVRIMSAPGLWIQRITTKEPTDDMIECAIMAFVAVLPTEDDAQITSIDNENILKDSDNASEDK